MLEHETSARMCLTPLLCVTLVLLLWPFERCLLMSLKLNLPFASAPVRDKAMAAAPTMPLHAAGMLRC